MDSLKEGIKAWVADLFDHFWEERFIPGLDWAAMKLVFAVLVVGAAVTFDNSHLIPPPPGSVLSMFALWDWAVATVKAAFTLAKQYSKGVVVGVVLASAFYVFHDRTPATITELGSVLGGWRPPRFTQPQLADWAANQAPPPPPPPGKLLRLDVDDFVPPRPRTP